MTIQEFTQSYCAPQNAEHKPRTIDLQNQVADMLNSTIVLDRRGRIEACKRIVSAELEVYDKSLPDYAFIEGMRAALNEVE